MAIPQPDIELLIEEFNTLRCQGRIITNQFRILGLQKKVNAVRNSDPNMAKAWQASLWCLIGDHEAMLKEGEAVLRVDPDGIAALHYSVTLACTGLFSKSRELYNQLDAELLTSDIELWVRGFVGFSFSRLALLADVMGIGDSEAAMIAINAQKVLEQGGVSESEVSQMLDIAGVVLREHGLLVSDSPQIQPYLSHGSLNISLPVKLSAEEVAELEWEFCLKLFAEMPDAPAHVVQVGFCVGGDGDDAN